MKKVELLAPAGSFDALRAAVNAGADAVYIGGTRFGARAYADNPQEDELIKGIEFCHIRGKKLYLTVNTLFKDDELSGMLEEYLRPYYSAGIDAVIVQDPGAMSFIGKHFPNLPIHVSTQASVTMAEGINRLMRLFPTITRVVPARELSIEEIKRFRHDTTADIEVFVHGALCYCYSGQCLMSSMIGGRSGNRGRCAQPCRKLYDGRYLLSPKDNCLLDSFGELIEAGVNSFKIEGRMKSPEYTAGVVSIYRKYIDLYYQLGREGYNKYIESHRSNFQKDFDILRELYNRGGFNNGYIHSHNGPDMMSFERPNHSGVKVGEIITVRGREAVIRFSSMVNAQDILEIRNGQDKVFEFTLGQGFDSGETFSTITMKDHRATVGQSVYRTKCNELINSITEQYIKYDSTVPVSCSFSGHCRETTKLTFTYGDISVSVDGSIAQTAQNQPTDADAVRRQLSKLGGTPFVSAECNIDIDSNVFIVMGELNRMRRDAVELLICEILKTSKRENDLLSYDADNIGISTDDNPAVNELTAEGLVKRLTVSVRNPIQMSAVIKAIPDCDIVCNLSSCRTEEAESFIELYRPEKIILGLPYVSRADVFDRLRKLVDDVHIKYPDVSFMVRTQEEINLLDELNCSYRKDYNLYTMNSEALRLYDGIFTVPVELNADEIEKLFKNNSNAELIIYGYQPVMFSAQCVYKNKFNRCRDIITNDFVTICDEMSHEFRCVQLCGFCMNIIYNSAKLNLFEQVDRIKDINTGHVRIDFTFEDDTEVSEVLEDYKCVFENGGLQLHKNKYDKYTSGHFSRGVQ